MRISDWSSDVCSSDLKPSGCNPDLRQVGEAIEVQAAAFAMQLPQPRAEQGDVRLDRVQRFALPPWQQSARIAMQALALFAQALCPLRGLRRQDRKSTRLNSSH